MRRGAPCGAVVSAHCCSAAPRAALAAQHPRRAARRRRREGPPAPPHPARARCQLPAAEAGQAPHVRTAAPSLPAGTTTLESSGLRAAKLDCRSRRRVASLLTSCVARMQVSKQQQARARAMCWHLWQRALCVASWTVPRRLRCAAPAASRRAAASGRERAQALLHLRARVRQIHQLRAQRGGVRRHRALRRERRGAKNRTAVARC
jgi:hypothetical protein